MDTYIAHINECTGAVQTVKEHCENTARLCRDYAVPELKEICYAAGLYHDIGKFQASFQKRIRGARIRVEHSGCGAQAVSEMKEYPFPMRLMMEYCIAGHHSGLPNGGITGDEEERDGTSLQSRLARTFEDFSRYQAELPRPEGDFEQFIAYLAGDCGMDKERLVDKFAFLTRYVFSCLVDADSEDTADFCKAGELPRKLYGDFAACLEQVNRKLQGFVCRTELQKTRALLQEQAFKRAEQDGEIYLLNMPTGSGKTLASVKIALERAIKGKKKRIIYIIPYNSIIDQTAEVFGNLFGESLEILRHQSTFSYEDEENGTEDYREAAKTAAENWDSPFVITTAVQFFESVYANKRGKLRKLHNMAESLLVFDEAHLMPQDYLQPCLQAAAFIIRYLHSEAVFLTATMPDFEGLLRRYALPDSRILRLIQDTAPFEKFKKCSYQYVGEISREQLLQKSADCPSALIIVNRKKTARELYRDCSGRKYHLSTYMTVFDRKRVLNEIRDELQKLEKDYPDLKDVPQKRKITIISTSLIEAGVDLDVYTVFRERSGLDSILQAGGRCNREGKREKGTVYVFDMKEEGGRQAMDQKENLAKGLLKRYKDISDVSCIEEYYRELFSIKKDEIQKNTMHQNCADLQSIPFRSYAERFELIDSRTVSLVVPQDAESRKLADELKDGKAGNVRKLQGYICSVQQKELEELIRQHAAKDYGTGIYCLDNSDYYDQEIGITFEPKDYFL